MPSLFNLSASRTRTPQSVLTITRIIEILSSGPRDGWAIYVRPWCYTDVDGRPDRPECPLCADNDRASLERNGDPLPLEERIERHINHADDVVHRVPVRLMDDGKLRLAGCACGNDGIACLAPLIDFGSCRIDRPAPPSPPATAWQRLRSRSC